MPPDLSSLTQDGFQLPHQQVKHLKIRSLAILSLRIALRAYFSTFRSMPEDIIVEPLSAEAENATWDNDELHTLEYCALYSQVIVHFHHFAELVCKDILRADDPLLVIEAARDAILFHKLLRKEDVSREEFSKRGVNDVDFKIAKDRLIALIKAQRLGQAVEWIVAHHATLESLAHLRNRLLHRGVFVLRYSALDRLVGGHVLPFVKKVLAMREYSGEEQNWKYQKLACDLDPLDEIVSACTGDGYDMHKMALLKELGRAAYQNALKPDTDRASKMAEAEYKAGVAAEVRDCPVCGVRSFLRFDHCVGAIGYREHFYYPDIPLHRECVCCGLYLDSCIKNPSEFALAIEDFWPKSSVTYSQIVDMDELRRRTDGALSAVCGRDLPADQTQGTAFAMILASELVGIKQNPDLLLIGAPHSKKSIELVTAYGLSYEHREASLDFVVRRRDATANEPSLLGCESEMHPRHRSGSSLELSSNGRPINGYVWDFDKLLKYPASRLLFVARIGQFGKESEFGKLRRVEATLTKHAKKLAHSWSDARLDVVLLPAGKKQRLGVRIGVGVSGGPLEFSNLTDAIR